MRRVIYPWAAVPLALAFAGAAWYCGAVRVADAAPVPAKAAKADGKLVGTWKLVSAKYGGKAWDPPEGATTLKHITPTHYSWLTYDKDGTVTRGAGGTYTLKGDDFTQTAVYGLAATLPQVNGKNTYACKLEDDTWHHSGKLPSGTTLEEVWERVKE